MADSDDSLDGLRDAIRRRGETSTATEEQRFQALAREYEVAVASLVASIREVASAVPELTFATEDEKEAFTSPAFPGRSLEIKDQRARLTRGEDFLLFDPTAGALASAMGQVRLSSSRPIPFLMERALYLVRGGPEGSWWGYRSAEDPSQFALPFTRKALVRMLRAVFA
jgi:hypothetical protein